MARPKTPLSSQTPQTPVHPHQTRLKSALKILSYWYNHTYPAFCVPFLSLGPCLEVSPSPFPLDWTLQASGTQFYHHGLWQLSHGWAASPFYPRQILPDNVFLICVLGETHAIVHTQRSQDN